MSSSNEPSQLSGQFHSAKGSAVEAVGNAIGSQDWVQSGKTEHASGEGEIKAAQAKGYAEGLTDQVSGYKDSVVGAVTGDKTKQISGNAQQESGKAQKEANAPA